MSRLTVDQAIEEAAGDLPDGYVILICVENGSACVEMHDELGDDVDIPPHEDRTLAEQIKDALNISNGQYLHEMES